MSNRASRLLSVAAVSVVLFASACNKSEPSAGASSAAPEKPNAAVDLANGAAVSGTVTLQGTAPAPKQIDMSQDPACAYASSTPNVSENYVVDKGKLANVFVYVKSGLEGKMYAPPKDPVVLDQKGCRYVPHVLAAMVGQPIRILNSDPAMHNIHPVPDNPKNPEFNVSQQPKGQPIEKTFDAPEVMMEIHCNQHPWMKALLSVQPNPFFAVTDQSGHFEIKGLPPGTYTLAAVHEKAGEQTMQITVSAKDSKTADFSFTAK